MEKGNLDTVKNRLVMIAGNIDVIENNVWLEPNWTYYIQNGFYGICQPDDEYERVCSVEIAPPSRLCSRPEVVVVGTADEARVL